VSARRDPPTVGKHEDEHLRRFVAARAADDGAAMRRWWDEVVTDMFDRMKGFVAAAHKGRLDADEHDLAVQLAMVRFNNNLIRTFRGSSMGELVNATRTLARGICMDVQRRSMRHARHGGRSLDEAPDPDDAGPSLAEADESRRRHEDDEAQRDREDFLAWAIPQLKESRRRVIEMTLEGVPLEELATALDLSHANAYQLRSRGLKDLKKLKEQYDA
jgi:RNA polymerase sigma factor (sigma-70 family)